jgi:hypothetical protein
LRWRPADVWRGKKIAAGVNNFWSAANPVRFPWIP